MEQLACPGGLPAFRAYVGIREQDPQVDPRPPVLVHEQIVVPQGSQPRRQRQRLEHHPADARIGGYERLVTAGQQTVHHPLGVGEGMHIGRTGLAIPGGRELQPGPLQRILNMVRNDHDGTGRGQSRKDALLLLSFVGIDRREADAAAGWQKVTEFGFSHAR